MKDEELSSLRVEDLERVGPEGVSVTSNGSWKGPVPPILCYLITTGLLSVWPEKLAHSSPHIMGFNKVLTELGAGRAGPRAARAQTKYYGPQMPARAGPKHNFRPARGSAGANDNLGSQGLIIGKMGMLNTHFINLELKIGVSTHNCEIIFLKIYCWEMSSRSNFRCFRGNFLRHQISIPAYILGC